MKQVLGLDIGVNSIGWALVAHAEDNTPIGLIDAGVRIFLEGVNEKGESKNQKRRIARQIRRMRFRKGIVKSRLRTIFTEMGWMPSTSEELQQWFQLNPYQLRVKALDEQIELPELARIIYHISMRRGFLSNRKSDRQSDDSGVVAKAIDELSQQIEQSGSRTLGEYLASLDPHETRLRKRYTLRQMYIDEFNLIWEKQSKYYPDILTDEMKYQIADYTLFYQRPLVIQKHLVGKCLYAPDKKRCPKSRLIFQEFRIWDKINNLRYIDEFGEEHELTLDQKRLLFNDLQKRKEKPFSAITKLLKLPDHTIYNLETESNSKLIGNDTNAKLSHSKYFGKRWYEFSREEQNRIVDVVQNVQKEDVLKRIAINDWQCDTETAENLVYLQLENGYGSLSEYVIKKVLPFMQQGQMLWEAIESAGIEKPAVQGGASFLDDPPNLRNPRVNRALNELKKVVNSIIRKYGKPTEVRIEMSRDLKLSKKEADRLNYRQNQERKWNEEARLELRRTPFNIINPSRDDVQKYRLWKECKERCPYTGKFISAAELFTQAIQVEHILPYSRTLDDSFQNKTLATAEANAVKSNRTPYEAFGSDEQRFGEILERIKATGNRGKYNKFRQQEVRLDEFIQNQLNDTRYIATEAKDYLKQVIEKVNVTKGQATATLRRVWNLNKLINTGMDNEKNRADHRHHAIDAFVVALTTPGMLNKLSRTKSREIQLEDRQMPAPYSAYREELDNQLRKMVISYQVRKKVSGPLHEETFYGQTDSIDKKGQRLFVVRKPVHVLTPKELNQIRDDRIREKLNHHIEQQMQITGKSQADIVKSLENEPFSIHTKHGEFIPVRKVRLLKPFSNVKPFYDKNGKPFKYAEFGNNHHIAIYEVDKGDGLTKREGIVTTLDTVYQRISAKLPPVDKTPNQGWKFIVSLSINEMVLNKDDGEIYRFQKVTKSGQMFFRHQFASTLKYNDQVISKYPSTLNVDKIKVSPIGEVWDCND